MFLAAKSRNLLARLTARQAVPDITATNTEMPLIWHDWGPWGRTSWAGIGMQDMGPLARDWTMSRRSALGPYEPVANVTQSTIASGLSPHQSPGAPPHMSITYLLPWDRVPHDTGGRAHPGDEQVQNPELPKQDPEFPSQNTQNNTQQGPPRRLRGLNTKSTGLQTASQGLQELQLGIQPQHGRQGPTEQANTGAMHSNPSLHGIPSIPTPASSGVDPLNDSPQYVSTDETGSGTGHSGHLPNFYDPNSPPDETGGLTAHHTSAKHIHTSHTTDPPVDAVPSRSRSIGHRAMSFMSHKHITYVLTIMFLIAIMSHMMPGPGGHNHRVPPPWGPNMEPRVCFRDWAWQVMVWSIYSDLDHRRKAAALVLQLRGGALQLVRSLPPQTLLLGGMVNGVATDPMTYIMHALSERYSRLGEETRLSAIAELFNFNRHGSERIDDLLTRFDVLRERAEADGQMQINIQGMVWLLLRACHVTDQQLMALLQPFGGLFPADAAQYTILITHLRRMGHIVENAPGNIAQQLRRPQGSQAYFTDADVYYGNADRSLPSSQAPPSNWAPSAPQQSPDPDNWWQQPQQDNWQSNTWQSNYWPAPQAPSPQWAGPAFTNDDWSDNGTDSDTESSLGEEDLECPLPATSTPNEIAAHFWWAYTKAKGNWRKFMGKPVRAVRRFIRRGHKGKGKGKGKGRKAGSAHAFLAALPDAEVEHVFKGKGKGRGGPIVRSSGKGKGRQGNPFGPDGEQMKCNVTECGSTQHFERDCPMKGRGKGKGGIRFTGLTTSIEGPLGDMLPIQQPTSTALVLMTNQVTPDTPTSTAPQPPTPSQQLPQLPLTSPPVANDPWLTNDPWLRSFQDVLNAPDPDLDPPYNQTPPWAQWQPTQVAPLPAASSWQIPQAAIPKALPPPPPVRTPQISTTQSLPPAPSHVARSPVPSTIINEAVQPPMQSTMGADGVREFRFVPPPAEFPPWVESISSLQLTRPYAQRNDMATLPPLFPGARTAQLQLPTRASLLEQPLQGTVDTFWRVQNTLSHFDNTGSMPAPNTGTLSRLDPAHHNYIDTLHLIQQDNERYANSKGRGKGPPQEAPAPSAPTAPTTSTAADEIEFDGDDRICSICVEEYQTGDAVLRLVCRHIFHIECWSNMLVSTDEDRILCPNCRGPGRSIARWRFIASPIIAYRPPPPDAPPLVVPISTPTASVAPAQSRAPSQDSYQSTVSHHPTVLPAWAAPTQQPTGFYHASTELPDGRPAIIVDPGAWVSLIGKNPARKIAQWAIKNGQQPQQVRMETPLTIQGVGNGTQTCEWRASLPIATLDDNDEGSVNLFEAPVVEGTGEDIPGLLGHQSCRKKNGVLQMAPHKECLSFPGPGGYKIEWSPGTRHFPLTPAPSGHLTIPCCEYQKVSKKGGLAKQSMTFHATDDPDATPETALPAASTASSSRDGAQPPQPPPQYQ